MAKMLNLSRALLSAVVCTAVSAKALSKDLNAVAEFLQPAYTALNFSALCARDNPLFVENASGARGTVLTYAQHVKAETIEFLTYEDAAAVLKMATSVALGAAKEKLYQLAKPGDHSGTVQAIQEWCEVEATQFVLQFMAQHDADHSGFLEALQKAKR